MSGFTLVTVTATELTPEGEEPAQGTIVATLTKAIRNGDVELVPTPVLGQLNDEGELLQQSGEPFQLPPTDNAGTTPTGAEYEWVIQLNNAPLRTFTAPLAHATSPVDITALEAL